ncbi:MAG: hypothetical protein GXO62_04485 [Epsilonproteobacteria bacterium]|nr:hypothetical protein [Campylobacterota bacterium]
MEARYFFELEDFDKAQKLAHEAYLINPYNRMAFTLEVQSKIAKEWQNFINDADTYFKKIEEIANKDKITKKDKLRVKIMLEILMDEYKTLKPSLLLPKDLKYLARKKYKEARELYEEIFGKRSG